MKYKYKFSTLLIIFAIIAWQICLSLSFHEDIMRHMSDIRERTSARLQTVLSDISADEACTPELIGTDCPYAPVGNIADLKHIRGRSPLGKSSPVLFLPVRFTKSRLWLSVIRLFDFSKISRVSLIPIYIHKKDGKK